MKRLREEDVDACFPVIKKLRAWPPAKPFGRPLSDHATERASLSQKRPYLGIWVDEDTVGSKRRLLNSGQTSVVAAPTQHKLQHRMHPWPEYCSQRTPASRAIAQPGSYDRGTSPHTPPVESSTPARLTAAQSSVPSSASLDERTETDDERTETVDERTETDDDITETDDEVTEDDDTGDETTEDEMDEVVEVVFSEPATVQTSRVGGQYLHVGIENSRRHESLLPAWDK
ncbi:hypothetical protein HDU80_002539, partial [Chytriomyces hyalinus]